MKTIIAFLGSLFQSPSVTAAKRAVAQLERDNAAITEAEALLARLETQKVEDARDNAAALQIALDNAKTDADKAEVLRNAEIVRQNDKTDATIEALQAAIRNAKDLNAKKLGTIAVKHNAQRAAEAADSKVATDALELVRAAAGDDSAE
ncbi:hypothetical protein BH10CYA1_BH10CYA1_31650 [soil metagenome]